MHELSIVESIVKTSDSFAKQQGINHVKQLTVQVGALTGVIPKYLQMYYSDISKGSSLEDSQLIIEEIPAEAFCKSCGNVFDPTLDNGHCPDCGSSENDTLHGHELNIKEMGYM